MPLFEYVVTGTPTDIDITARRINDSGTRTLTGSLKTADGDPLVVIATITQAIENNPSLGGP